MKTISVSKLIKSLVILIAFIVLFLLERWTYPGNITQGTVKLYDKNSNLVYEYAKTKGYKREIKLDKLNDDTIKAVLATEDKRFFIHPGIDPLALARALVNNIKGLPSSGASTITQQLVRKVSFDGTKMSNSYIRKIREIATAIRYELTYSKEQILETYLNEMYFGNFAYGIESASNIYFGKSANNLTLAESAFLASIIASPYKYDPVKNFEIVKTRQEHILQLMAKNQVIDKDKLTNAVVEKIAVEKLYTPENTESYYFADYMLKEVTNLPEVKKHLDANKSLNIYTTLDLNKQKEFYQVAKYNLSKIDPRHKVSNASAVLINNQTGGIEVMLGGMNYFDYANDGSVNMATASRQPGSAIKPITYALAFREGYYPSYIITDEKKMYVTKDGNGYVPQNYDNIYHGKVSLRTALASSFNIPAVELVDRIGVDKFIDLANSMGLKNYNKNAGYDLAITLGGAETTLLDLSNVYATFAREGDFIPYFAVDRVTTGDGKDLYNRNDQKPYAVLGTNGRAISYLITDILSDSKARMPTFGEKNLLNLSKKTAVKTGTTSNWHDVWTVGYNKTYTLGVWAGNNDNSPMSDISGITGATPIWNAIFEKIYQTETYQPFDIPAEIESRQVCKQTGLPQECTEMYTDLFIKNQPLSNSANLKENTAGLEIVNPRQNAVFKPTDNTLSQNSIALEVRADDTIRTVEWVLNGRSLAKTTTPFSYFLPATGGKYTLMAVGTTTDGKELLSSQVDFEVL